MYSKKAPFCLWPSFPFYSPPSLLLVPFTSEKKKGKRSITVYSPYYLIFALFPILPSTLPSQQSKIRGGGMHTLSKKKKNREDLKIYSI
jgi:hypothetical protein